MTRTSACPQCGGPVYRDHNNRRSVHCSHRCAGAARRKEPAARAPRVRASRAVGCMKCGGNDHQTKTCGRVAYTNSSRSRRPLVRIGPVLRKRLGIVTVVPVVSSWLVNPA